MQLDPVPFLQLAEVLLDGGPALLHVNNSSKSWSKATKKQTLKIPMVKRDLQLKWLQSRTKGEAECADCVCVAFLFSLLEHSAT